MTTISEKYAELKLSGTAPKDSGPIIIEVPIPTGEPFFTFNGIYRG